MGDAGVIFSATKRAKKGGAGKGTQSKEIRPGLTKKRAGGLLRHSVYSMKRVARLPSNEREEVMRILRKHGRRRKKRGSAKQPGPGGSQVSSEGGTTSASANNDWENWVAMQGSDDAGVADVMEVGKYIGVTFNGDKENMFSALSKPRKDKLATACPPSEGGVVGATEC
jgi:hypothetical protein